jgi:hypothetical protein
MISRPKDVLRFALAGNARLTLVSKRTGTRFTYRVRQKDPTKPHFVSLLNGPDNTSDYLYMGTIFDGAHFKLTAKSAYNDDAPSVKAFKWVWRHLVAATDDTMPTDLEVWHEGRCGRCGRVLTVPESIERGIGPECAGMMGIP